MDEDRLHLGNSKKNEFSFGISLDLHYLCSENVKTNDEDMEAIDFKKYSDEEFKEALMATLNLKKEWMASVAQREKELGIR